MYTARVETSLKDWVETGWWKALNHFIRCQAVTEDVLGVADHSRASPVSWAPREDSAFLKIWQKHPMKERASHPALRCQGPEARSYPYQSNVAISVLDVPSLFCVLNCRDSRGAYLVGGRASGTRRETKSQQHRPLQWGLPADGSRPQLGK